MLAAKAKFTETKNYFRIKDKINNPPRDISQQEVSKRFKKFVKLKEETKAGKQKKRKIC